MLFSIRNKTPRLARWLVPCLALLLAGAPALHAQSFATFSNPAPLGLEEVIGGPASIYPSTINVSGLTSVLRKVTVTLHNLNHDFPDDLDILLVGPTGTNVILMSDCGIDNPLFEVTVILDDDAPDPLPDGDPGIFTGTYRPANYGIIGTETMPAPAPPKPWGNRLAAFTNTNPNGVWSLYVVDDLPESGGAILEGWSLTFTLGEPLADLSVSLAADTGLVPAGGEIVYTTFITNRGPADTEATLTNTLPVGVEFVSVTTSSGSCMQESGHVICTLGSLPPSGSVIVQLAVRHLAGVALTNAVTIRGAAVDLAPLNNHASLSTPVGAAPDLAITGFVLPHPAVVTQPVTLSLRVTNVGSLTATNVVLTNTLPPGIVFLSVTTSVGSCGHAAGVVVCDLGNLDIGSEARVSIDARPQIPGDLTNRFHVAMIGLDAAPANNLGAFTIPVMDAADLRITPVSVPATVPLGQDWIVVLAVTNLGPGASAAKLVQQLEPGLEFIAATGFVDGCTNDNGIIVCDLGPVSTNTSRVVTLTVRQSMLGAASYSLSASGSLVELNPSDNELVAGTTFVPAADLVLSGNVAPNPVWSGETTTYTLAVSNAGPLTATGAFLTGTLPSGASFLSMNSDYGSCVLSNEAVHCNLGGIAAGSNAHVSITVRLDALGAAVLSAAVTASETDPASSNNAATPVARVVAISGEFASAGATSIPELGTGVPYPSTLQVSGLTATVARVRVTLANLNHSYADDLDILLVAPDGRGVLILSDAGGSFDAGGVTLVLDATAPESLPDSTSLTSGNFRPTDHDPGVDGFPASAPAGPYSNNLFNFTGIDPNGVWSLYIVDDSAKDAGSLSGWSLEIATLDPIADLEVTTAVAANPAPAFAPLEILCVISNRGPAIATDVRFTNHLSTGVFLHEFTVLSSQGGCDVEDGVVICALGDLPPGASAQVFLQMLPLGEGMLTNTASAGSDAVDIMATNDSAGLVVSFLEPPVIVIDPFDQYVLEGDPVTFTGLAVGAAPLAYQWLRDGAPVAGETNSELTLAVTVAADTGFYQLQVSNAVGTVLSAPAYLLVSGPPFISIVPPQAVAEDGGTDPIPFEVGDTETSSDQILVTGDSSDHLLVPVENIVFGGFDSNRTIQITPLPDAFGPVTIHILADDGAGNVAQRSFLLTITPANDPPSLSDIGDQAAGENIPFSVAFTVADLESNGDELIYTATTSNPDVISTNGIVFSGSGSNRVALITPQTNSFGSAVLTFTVSDSDGASASDSFMVTVEQLNVHPFVEAVADLTIDEDSGVHVVQLTGIVSGPFNDPPGNLQLSAFSDRPDLIPNPVVDYTNGSLTGTLTFASLTNGSGTALLSVVVNDGAATNSTFIRTFAVHITPINDPPALHVASSASALKDTLIILPVAVNDPDDAPSTVMLAAQSSDEQLVPPANVTFGGAGASRSVTITPALAHSGTAVLTLIATDPHGAQTQAVLTVNILPTNSAPTLDPVANLTLPEDAGLQTVSLTGISAGGLDESENVVISAVSSQPALIPNPVVNHAPGASTGTLQFTPAANATGSVTITITLDDQQPFNSLATRSFTVTLTPALDTPVISAIPNQVTAEDTVITIPFTVSSPDAPAYSITVSGSASNAVLIPATNIVISGAGTNRSVTITPARDLSGTNLITLVASNGGAGAARSFLLVVTPVNDPPTLNPVSNFVTNRGNGNTTYVLSLSGISSGASNESQTLNVTAVSSNPALIPNPTLNYTGGSTTGTLGLRPVKDGTGASVISVTVTDGGGASNTQSFLAYIKNNNVVPTLAGLTNIVLNEDTTAGPLPFTVRDSQTTGSNLTLMAKSTNPSLLPTNNLIFGGGPTNRTLTFTPASNQSGTANITLTVIDATFGLSNFTFTVTVNPINDAPTIAPIGSVALSEDSPPTLVPVNVADVDSPHASLVISAVSGNTTLLPNANILATGSGTNRGLVITPAANQSGSSLITVRVSDGVVSNSTTFTLTVNGQNDAPVLSGIAAQTTDEDTPSAPIAFTVADAETPANALVLAVSSSNLDLVASNGIVISGSGNNRTVVVTPSPDHSGTTIITITATDASNAVATTSFPLTVQPVNEAPTLDPLSSLALNENAGPQMVTLTGIGSGSTNKEQPVMVTAATEATNLVFNLSVDYPGPGDTATLLFQPVPGVHGTALITVTINDGQPLNALTTQTLTVVIQASPAISQPPDAVTQEDTPVTVTFAISDAESSPDALTLVATSSNPLLLPEEAFAFSEPGPNRTVTITPATNASGIALVTLQVADPQGGFSQRHFYLEVQPVVDPIIIVAEPGSLTRIAGEPASFEIVALSSLMPLSYQWFYEGAIMPDQTGNVLSFAAVSTANAGSYTVTASNADGSVMSVAAVLTVELPFRIASLMRNGTTNLITFTTMVGFNYTVEFKNALSDAQWQFLPAVSGNGDAVTVEDADAGLAMRFYRVREEIAP